MAKTPNRTDAKSFFALRLLLDCTNYLHTALMNVASLEAECIVFATEGWLLAHDFISDCGIGINQAIFLVAVASAAMIEPAYACRVINRT